MPLERVSIYFEFLLDVCNACSSEAFYYSTSVGGEEIQDVAW